MDKIEVENARQIQVGDWFVLDDPSWQADAQNLKIGQVASPPIASRALPGYDQVEITPSATLMQMRDVLVMVK